MKLCETRGICSKEAASWSLSLKLNHSSSSAAAAPDKVTSNLPLLLLDSLLQLFRSGNEEKEMEILPRFARKL